MPGLCSPDAAAAAPGGEEGLTMNGCSVAVTTAAASRDGGEATVEGGQELTKLMEEEVQWIMNHKPRAVEKQREIMRRGDKVSASLKNEFVAFQSWVRAEYNEKGYVAVDDKWLADRDQVRQWAYEQFQDMFDRLELKFSPSHIGDYSDMYATDDE